MNCKICGSEVPQGSSYCRVCGSAVEAASVSAPPVQQSSLRCSVCGNSIAPGAKFCNVCGNPSAPVASAAPVAAQPSGYASAAPAGEASAPKGEAVKEKLNQVLSFAKDPKNKKTVFIGISAIALILVAVILISTLGGGGPVSSISGALEKTVIGGNFTVEFDAKYDGEKISCNAMVDMNVKKHEITALLEMKMSGSKMVCGIYDQTLFMYYPDFEYGYSQDIGDQLDDIFEKYEENKDLDLEKLAELIDDMTGEDIEDYVDLKETEKGLKKLTGKLDSKSWLEENAGYSTEKKDGATVHVFEPDMYELMLAVLPFFEKAIEDYDDVYEALEDSEDMLSDVDITLEIGVKSGKLTVLEVDAAGVKISAEFTDVGKTKIDVEELQDYLDECEG